MSNDNSRDNSGQSLTLPGGVNRYQVGAQPSEAQASKPAAPTGQWVGDTTRVTVRDGRVVEETVANVTRSHDAAPEGDHYLDKARSPSGRPLSRHEVDERSIVKTPSGEFPVSTLLRTGELVKNADGRIVEASKNANAFDKFDKEEKPAAPRVEAGEDLDSDGQKLANTLISGTSDGDRMAALRQAIDGNGISPATLERIASSLHTEPDKAAEMAEALAGKFSDQAARAVSQVAPVDLRSVSDWARVNRPAELKKAMWGVVQDDRGAGFKAITQDYIANLPSIDPGMILGAQMPKGVSAREHNGRIILKTPDGSEVDWKSAVASGLVTVSKRSGGR